MNADVNTSPELSLVVPVYNEEAVLPALFARLFAALDKLGRSYEVVFVDDGSRDRSKELLRKQCRIRSRETRVVYLRANAGQHAAILAGFDQARGLFVVTLDADLQNPPEEIGRLVDEWDKGHDYVGSIRRVRNDARWRHWASRAMNLLRERITNIRISDQGCMLRGYDKEVVNAILASNEVNTFIPALAYVYSASPVEIRVDHEARAAGESKYPLFKLVHLNFDLVTGFSLMPLQVFSLAGVLLSLGSFGFVFFLFLRRLVVGPEVEGVFTLFAILFFLIGILLFGIGLLGEYVGRIYVQSQGRPRYLVREVLHYHEEPVSQGRNE